jgi:lipopolysaccharide export system protein LptA
MRRASWLLLAAVLAILVSVGATYLKRREVIARDAPASPRPLEVGLDGRFGDWCYTQNDGDRPKVKICAKSQRQLREPSVWELEGVELQLYREGATAYDLVRSRRAEFDLAAKTLYSDGEVEITMAVPASGEVHARLLKIRSSGVRFASDTGKAQTDRRAVFEFDRGGGSAVGAEYDPNLQELVLKSEVALDWRGSKPGGRPLHIEAGQAVYREREARVELREWSRLTRGSLHIDAGATDVTLEEGEVRLANAKSARGAQDDPGRKVEFAADDLTVDFGEGMVISKIQGVDHASLVSTASTSRTTITGDRMDLAFTPADGESVLTAAAAHGRSVAESAPVPRAGVELPDTRTLRSETIRLSMRPGGREIEQVETDGAGTLDFVPNRPGQARRFLQGDRIWIAYGSENRIQSFRSINVSTRTEQPSRPLLTTRSKDFLATFEAAGNRLTRIEQSADFQYEEGDRQARAARAVLDQLKNVMTLDGSARVWDPAGSASADRIEFDQTSGDYVAEGRVATTRQPEKKGSSSAMLSNHEVTQARARRLVTANRSQHLRYEGNAVAWQGANRVEADRIEFDRARRVMEAHGNVVSQFVDRAAAANAKGKAASPLFTVVRAPALRYTEENRLAYYSGGVALSRPGLTVDSGELWAYLNDAASESSLDKAVADGKVKIVSTTSDGRGVRTRTGLGQHADYYAQEQKLILTGGEPQLIDSRTGKTTGRELTWFANNDRLLVDGEEKKPAVTTIRKK